MSDLSLSLSLSCRIVRSASFILFSLSFVCTGFTHKPPVTWASQRATAVNTGPTYRFSLGETRRLPSTTSKYNSLFLSSVETSNCQHADYGLRTSDYPPELPKYHLTNFRSPLACKLVLPCISTNLPALVSISFSLLASLHVHFTWLRGTYCNWPYQVSIEGSFFAKRESLYFKKRISCFFFYVHWTNWMIGLW